MSSDLKFCLTELEVTQLFCRGGGKRDKKKERHSHGGDSHQPRVAAPQASGSRAPLLVTPPPREPSPPAYEVVYVGDGRVRTTVADRLDEQQVRIPDSLRPRVAGLDITVDEASVAVRNFHRMQARAHALARELGVVAPLGMYSSEMDKFLLLWAAQSKTKKKKFNFCSALGGREIQFWNEVSHGVAICCSMKY